MNIIFFGSDPWFSPPVLSALLKAGHEVPIVVTKGDAIDKGQGLRDKGKGKTKIIPAKTTEDITVKEMVKRLNGYNGQNGHQPFNHSNHSNHFSHSFIPDAIVLAAFGPPFLSSAILKWPKYGCFNVHASLLPRWRGASPVFAALAAGDQKTGVSIMKMTEEIDRGPILGQAGLKIGQPDIMRPGLFKKGRAFLNYDTRETLTKKVGILGGKLIVETLIKLSNDQIIEVKQPPKSPTFYTHRLTKDSGRIDWQKSPVEIERFIRAVTPWPGATTNGQWLMINGQWQKFNNLKILSAHLEPNSLSINHQSLIIDLVQLPGKNPVVWKQFLAGHPNTKLE